MLRPMALILRLKETVLLDWGQMLCLIPECWVSIRIALVLGPYSSCVSKYWFILSTVVILFPQVPGVWSPIDPIRKIWRKPEHSYSHYIPVDRFTTVIRLWRQRPALKVSASLQSPTDCPLAQPFLDLLRWKACCSVSSRLTSSSSW